LTAKGVDLSKMAGNVHSGQYLPHVDDLRSVQGEWNLAAVDKRGRELADLVWQRVAPWLGMTP
jgi:hypothetical protein